VISGRADARPTCADLAQIACARVLFFVVVFVCRPRGAAGKLSAERCLLIGTYQSSRPLPPRDCVVVVQGTPAARLLCAVVRIDDDPGDLSAGRLSDGPRRRPHAVPLVMVMCLDMLLVSWAVRSHDVGVALFWRRGDERAPE
jgi:hypothetical protein